MKEHGINAVVGACADPSLEECESLVGKTIARVEATEYDFKLIFTDGSSVVAEGHSYADSCLHVTVRLYEGE